jgi:hypothetical protein
MQQEQGIRAFWEQFITHKNMQGANIYRPWNNLNLPNLD